MRDRINELFQLGVGGFELACFGLELARERIGPGEEFFGFGIALAEDIGGVGELMDFGTMVDAGDLLDPFAGAEPLESGGDGGDRAADLAGGEDGEEDPGEYGEEAADGDGGGSGPGKGDEVVAGFRLMIIGDLMEAIGLVEHFGGVAAHDDIDEEETAPGGLDGAAGGLFEEGEFVL